jgi:hypothetical protein
MENKDGVFPVTLGCEVQGRSVNLFGDKGWMITNMGKTFLTIIISITLFCCKTESVVKYPETPSEDEKLKNAYVAEDYDTVLDCLKNGADGGVFFDNGMSILFDVYQKYDKGNTKIDEIFDYYLSYRKECFKDPVVLFGKCENQTVGSYIAHFGNIDLIRRIATEKIPVNSPKEDTTDTVLINLALASNVTELRHSTFGVIEYNLLEKHERMNLLLDAGADATLQTADKKSIFLFFQWYPIDEDFTDVLDKMLKQGADIYAKDDLGRSALTWAVYPFALSVNSERYIEYLLRHGVEVTQDDIDLLEYNGPVNTMAEKEKLDHLRKLLRDNVVSNYSETGF